MKERLVKGKLGVKDYWGTPQYRVFRGFDVFDLDSALWNNTNDYDKEIIIENLNTKEKYAAKGKLKADYKLGYERYMVGAMDLSAILQSMVGNRVIISLKNFD
jgi:hypothetical protein